jgi:hypothetical protein
MVMFARTDSHIADALQFLRARQVSSGDPRYDGGWAVNTSGGVPVTESTALVGWLLGRIRLFLAADAPDLGRALAWLVRNQNADGGWGSVFGQPSRTWLTALAVRAVSQLSRGHEAGNRGVDWLTTHAVSTSAGWGERPGTPPTTTHTALVLTALVEAGVDLDRPVVARAFEWLDSTLQPAQLHEPAARMESHDVDFVGPDGTSRTWVSVVWHPGLPHAVSALMRGPAGIASPKVFAAVRAVVSAQGHDGRWPGSDSAAHSSIWDVWPYLDALSDVLALARRGDVLTLLTSGAVMVQRAGAGQVDPLQVFTLARRQRRLALFKRHWATLLLVAAVLASVVVAAVGRVGWTDVVWGLAVPILLFLIQEAWQRRP